MMDSKTAGGVAVTETLDVVRQGIRYSVRGRHLEISRAHARLAVFDLCPAAATPVRIGAFRRQGESFWAPLEGGVDGRAVLAMQNGFLSYTVETRQTHFDRLTYFPAGRLDADLWHSFIWAQRDREWDTAVDVSIRVGDTRPDTVDPREGTVVDPGDTPAYWPGRGGPRTCAVHHPEVGWWGICIPGPLPVCDTYFTMTHRRFEILFDYLHPGCNDGFMPTVHFVLPLSDPHDPYSVFGPFWDLNEPWRLVPGRDYEPTKFTGLARCHPWEAMQHAAGNGFSSPIPPARLGSPMNGDFLLGLLEELVDIEPSVRWHFQLPQGWFRNIGDFAVGENFGGEEGFRRLAASFRDSGHLLTVHVRLAHFNERSEVGREHPEWKAKVRPRRRKPYFWSANEAEEGVTELMDVTREEVRGHLKRQMKRFLSGEPGCLDMDGVQPTGDNWPSALDYELADDDYGVGDLLAYKINKELVLYGKSIKPWALVQGQGIEGIGNPLYGLSQEMSTTEDHLSVPIHTVQQLRLLTNCFPTAQLHVASYCTTRTKALVAWPLSVAVGRPEIDNPRAFTSAALDDNWIPMDHAYTRRMAAILTAYANSPWTPDTSNVPVRVEGNGLRMDVHAGRKRTQGKLAGFYGALSLGSNTVVTYSETRAVAVSMVSKTAAIPLPPRARVQEVVRVLHSGETREHDYVKSGEGMECHIPDAAGEVKCVEVRYVLDDGEEITE